MRSKVTIILVIFLLSAAARFIYVEQIKENVLFSYPTADSGDYHKAGMKLAAGTMTEAGRKQFLRIPLYQNFLGGVYKLAGPDVYLACMVQVLLGGASCCFTYLLGRGVFGDRTGILAGVIAAFYWPFAAFTAKTLPVNLAIFFSLLSALCLHQLIRKGKWQLALAGGALLAFASLARPNFLLLLPVLALWLFFSFAKRSGMVKGVLYSLALLAGFIFVMVPAGLADYSERKEFIPVQRNYAVTVYMGSNLELIELRPNVVWRKKMMDLLNADLTSHLERDLYWIDQIKNMITEDPAGYFKSFLEKIYILLNPYEFAPYESINYFRKRSSFLSLPFPGFGSIVTFAIAGIFFAWKKRKKEAMPLFLFTAVYFISLLPFPPLSRYRLPIVPFLIIFTAFCILDLFEAARSKKWAHIAKSACFILPVLVLTNVNFMQARLESFNRPFYDEGVAYLEAGDAASAVDSLKKALENRPRDADIYEAMGDAFFKMEDLDKAEENYKKALEIEPVFPEAMEKLGIIYGKKGDLDRAIFTFKKVLASFPAEYASTHINLATAYSLKGDIESTEKELKRALYLEPENRRALYRLQTIKAMEKYK